jgi:hypothetical protein
MYVHLSSLVNDFNDILPLRANIVYLANNYCSRRFISFAGIGICCYHVLVFLVASDREIGTQGSEQCTVERIFVWNDSLPAFLRRMLVSPVVLIAVIIDHA